MAASGLAAPRRLWTLLLPECESFGRGWRVRPGAAPFGARHSGVRHMVRISAIFIAVCMVLIAGSIGFVVYLRFGLTGAESFLVGLGVLTALAVYNAVAARSRDRAEVSDQIASISRSSADLARQLAEFGRQLGTVETKVDSVLDKALASAQPLAVEIEELSTLVKHLADSVAAHEAALAGLSGKQRIAPAAPARHGRSRDRRGTDARSGRGAGCADRRHDRSLQRLGSGRRRRRDQQRHRRQQDRTLPATHRDACRSARCATTRRCRA